MKVSLNFKDDKATPGTLHGEVTIDFDINMKAALDALGKLQASNIPGAIAAVLSKKEPEVKAD